MQHNLEQMYLVGSNGCWVSRFARAIRKTFWKAFGPSNDSTKLMFTGRGSLSDLCGPAVLLHLIDKLSLVPARHLHHAIDRSSAFVSKNSYCLEQTNQSTFRLCEMQSLNIFLNGHRVIPQDFFSISADFIWLSHTA